jgi:hypothetical protein
MTERALFRRSEVHECGHYQIDDDYEAEATIRAATRERIHPAGADDRSFYFVAERHQSFARLLIQLDLTLVVVPVERRLFLGVACNNAIKLRRRTVDIFRALQRRPKLYRALNRDLGVWRVRTELRGRMTLWWPGVEVFEDWLH